MSVHPQGALTWVRRQAAVGRVLLRHRVQRRRAMWSRAPSCRATRLDREETIAVAPQGVWHARGNRATADDVTLAVVRGHRPEILLRPSIGEGATICWEEVGV
jgi:hypothetical protein